MSTDLERAPARNLTEAHHVRYRMGGFGGKHFPFTPPTYPQIAVFLTAAAICVTALRLAGGSGTVAHTLAAIVIPAWAATNYEKLRIDGLRPHTGVVGVALARIDLIVHRADNRPTKRRGTRRTRITGRSTK